MKVKDRPIRVQNPVSKAATAPVMQPRSEAVNWLNIGLMIASCGVAIVAPFQTFILAYIVLGPLHYLTEISWLHDRKYFARRKAARWSWLALVLITVVILTLFPISSGPASQTISPVFAIILICLVFASAAAAVYVRGWRSGLALCLLLALAFFSLNSFQVYVWAFVAVYLLLTIIHVLIFTGAFILHGALKSRSRIGMSSFFVFTGCAILAATVTLPFSVPSERMRQLYLGFEFLNKALLVLLHRPAGVYEAVGAGVMRLIAFAYLYHYLNWFSKTSVIKWHEVSTARAGAILASWLAGGLIYLYDYRLALAVFYFASVLHVFLEFPLNHQTFVEIGKSFRSAQFKTRPATS